jgi:hypothetical protein
MCNACVLCVQHIIGVFMWFLFRRSIILCAALSIPQEQAHRVVFCMSGECDISKQRDCVPHDIGDPGKNNSIMKTS